MSMQSLKATVLSNVWNERKQDLKLIISGIPAIYNFSDFEIRTLEPNAVVSISDCVRGKLLLYTFTYLAYIITHNA